MGTAGDKITVTADGGLVIWAEFVLSAGRLDDAIKLAPDREAEVRQLAGYDPSGNNAYLGWMTRQLLAGQPVALIADAVERFHKARGSLSVKDIYQYGSVADVQTALTELATTRRQKQIEKERGGTGEGDSAEKPPPPEVPGAELVGETADHYVYHVSTYEASQALGTTNWCVVRDESHWNDYTGRGIEFYYHVPFSGPPAEFAVAVHSESGMSETYDVNDQMCPVPAADFYKEKGVTDVSTKIVDIVTRVAKGDTSAVGEFIDRESLPQIPDVNDRLKIVDKLVEQGTLSNSVAEALARGFVSGVRDTYPLYALLRTERSWVTPEILSLLAREAAHDHGVVDKLVQNAKLPPEAITALLTSALEENDPIIVERIAQNPNTSHADLTRIIDASAFDPYDAKYYLRDVAQNPNLPEDLGQRVASEAVSNETLKSLAMHTQHASVLRELSKSDSEPLLGMVIRNSNTPEDVYHTLAGSTDKIVLHDLARSKNTPTEILTQLLHDHGKDDSAIRTLVVRNPRTDPDVLDEAARSDHGMLVLVLNSGRAPAKTLEYGAAHSSPYVRGYVARNSITPTEVLEHLLNDPFGSVSDAARVNLDDRQHTAQALGDRFKRYLRDKLAPEPETTTVTDPYAHAPSEAKYEHGIQFEMGGEVKAFAPEPPYDAVAATDPKKKPLKEPVVVPYGTEGTVVAVEPEFVTVEVIGYPTARYPRDQWISTTPAKYRQWEMQRRRQGSENGDPSLSIPTKWYHGTTLEHGPDTDDELDPKHTNFEPAVWLTSSIPQARSYAESAAAVVPDSTPVVREVLIYPGARIMRVDDLGFTEYAEAEESGHDILYYPDGEGGVPQIGVLRRGVGKFGPIVWQSDNTQRHNARRRTASDDPPKATAEWHGLTVAIEHRGGDVRHPEGPFPTKVPEGIVGYGYFEGLPAEDGDSLDVIVGDTHVGDTVYVAAQNSPEGEFQQFKVMLGFDSEAEAEACFKLMWPVEMFGGIEPYSTAEFLEMLLPKLVMTAAKISPIGINELKRWFDDPKTTVTMLSAHLGEMETGSGNKKRHQTLLNDLWRIGIPERDIRTLRGQWGRSEKSLLVRNLDFDTAVALGQKYGQDSIIYKDPSGLAGMYSGYRSFDTNPQVRIPLRDGKPVYGSDAVGVVARPQKETRRGPSGGAESTSQSVSFSIPYDFDAPTIPWADIASPVTTSDVPSDYRYVPPPKQKAPQEAPSAPERKPRQLYPAFERGRSDPDLPGDGDVRLPETASRDPSRRIPHRDEQSTQSLAVVGVRAGGELVCVYAQHLNEPRSRDPSFVMSPEQRKRVEKVTTGPSRSFVRDPEMTPELGRALFHPKYNVEDWPVSEIEWLESEEYPRDPEMTSVFSEDVEWPERATYDSDFGLSVQDLKAPDLTGDTGKENIKRVLDEATEEEVDVYRDWYLVAHNQAKMIAAESGHPLDVIAAVIATLSPGMRWEENVRAARRLALGQSLTGVGGHYPVNVYKALRALKTGDPKEALTGDLAKVYPFYETILNPKASAEKAVVDRHMFAIWFGTPEAASMSWGGTGKGFGPKVRRKIQQDIQEIAKEYGLTTQGVQAITWVLWRNRVGEARPASQPAPASWRRPEEALEPMTEEDWEQYEPPRYTPEASRAARLVQKHRDETDRKEWALVSKSDASKVLKWFGSDKPSEDAVSKEEQRIHSFASVDGGIVTVAFAGEQRDYTKGDKVTLSSGMDATVVRKEDRGGGITRYIVHIDGGTRDGDQVAATPSAMSPRTAASEPLVALHNLSANNLLHAGELGGLVAPSIAITKQSHPFTNFGDITLVAPMSLVDPAKEPVFDADIYSPRYPSPRYKPNAKEVRKLQEDLKDYIERTESYYSDYEHELEQSGVEGIVSSTYKRPALQLAFLERVKGADVKTPMRNKAIQAEWVQAPSMSQFFSMHPFDWNWRPDTPEWAAFSAAVAQAIQEYWNTQEDLDPELRQDLIDTAMSYYLGDDGQVFFGRADRIDKSYKAIGQTEVDKYAFRELLDEMIKPFEDEFEEWAREQLEATQGERYLLTEGGARRKYTPENVLKMMTRKTRGGEGFNYGMGSLRALGAKRFRSLDQMQRASDRIVPDEEFQVQKKEMEGRFFKLLEKLKFYHPASDSMRFSDALISSIGESYKRGRGLSSELKRDGFQDVPQNLLSDIEEFRSDLVAMPTHYFEAKPQRLVELREFAGAAVPQNAKPAVFETLKQNGLRVETYDPESPETRNAAVNRITSPLPATAAVTTVTAAGLVNLHGFDTQIAEALAEAVSDVFASQASVTRPGKEPRWVRDYPEVSAEEIALEAVPKARKSLGIKADTRLGEIKPDGLQLQNDEANIRFDSVRVMLLVHTMGKGNGYFNPSGYGTVVIDVPELLRKVVIDKRAKGDAPSVGELTRVFRSTIGHELRHAADWAYQETAARGKFMETVPRGPSREEYINTPTELLSFAGNVAEAIYASVGNDWRALSGKELFDLAMERDSDRGVLENVRPENRDDFLRRVVKGLEQLSADNARRTTTTVTASDVQDRQNVARTAAVDPNPTPMILQHVVSMGDESKSDEAKANILSQGFDLGLTGQTGKAFGVEDRLYKYDPHGVSFSPAQEKYRDKRTSVFSVADFQNPLVMPLHDTQDRYAKKVLSERYGGRTGKALRRALIKDGYDAVIFTGTGGYIAEVVALKPEMLRNYGTYEEAAQATNREANTTTTVTAAAVVAWIVEASKRFNGFKKLLEGRTDTRALDAAKEAIEALDPGGKKGYLNWAIERAREAALAATDGRDWNVGVGDRIMEGPVQGTITSYDDTEDAWVIETRDGETKRLYAPSRTEPTKTTALLGAAMFTRTVTALTAFDEVRDFAPNKDIKAITSVKDLEHAAAQAKEQWYAEPRKERAKWEVLLDEPSRKVIRYDNKDASCWLSGGSTDWCVTKWHQHYYEDYTKRGTLYEVQLGGDKYLAHVLTSGRIGELKDAKNNSVGSDIKSAVQEALSAAGIEHERTDPDLEGLVALFEERGWDAEDAEAEAQVWHAALGDDAYDWIEYGFASSDDAVEWHDAGFDAGDASDWVNHGFDPDDAELAKSWRDAGFEPEQAHNLEYESVDPEVAARFREHLEELEGSTLRHLSGEDDETQNAILDAIDRYDPRDFNMFIEAWIGTSDPRVPVDEAAQGYVQIDDDDIAEAFVANKEPLTNAQKYIELNRYENPVAFALLERHRISFDDAMQWDATFADSGVGPVSDITKLYGHSLSPDAAKAWLTSGFAGDPQTIAAWNRAGFTPEEAAAWQAAGWTNVERAKKQKELGLSHAEPQGWDDNVELLARQYNLPYETAQSYWEFWSAQFPDQSVQSVLTYKPEISWWFRTGLPVDQLKKIYAMGDAVQRELLRPFTVGIASPRSTPPDFADQVGVFMSAGQSPSVASYWALAKGTLQERLEGIRRGLHWDDFIRGVPATPSQPQSETTSDEPRQAYRAPDREPGEGAGVFLRVPAAIARHWPRGREGHDAAPPHVTVALIEGPLSEEDRDVITSVVADALEGFGPIPVEMAKGVEWFTNDKGEEIAHKGFHPKTAERLAEAHTLVTEALNGAGYTTREYRDHEYQPHATLGYCDERVWADHTPEGGWRADDLEIWGWDDDVRVKLGGEGIAKAAKRRRKRRRFVGEVYYRNKVGKLYATKRDAGNDASEVRFDASARILKPGMVDYPKAGGRAKLLQAAAAKNYDAFRDGEELVLLNTRAAAVVEVAA